MRIDRRLCGWKRDDDERDKLIEELGPKGTVYGARPELRGYWQQLVRRGVTGVFLWQYENEFHRDEPYFDDQARGTCVARGFYKIAQLAMAYRARKGGHVGRPAILAYEPIYWGSRNIIGGGRINGDGSVGSWAARYLRDYGVCERKRYSGQWDLSRDQETLSCNNSARPPQDLFDESAKHKAQILNCNEHDVAADCIAGGKPPARCHNTLYGDRDANGMSRRQGDGAHCQAIVGVFLDPQGRTGFVERQSWGKNTPGGPMILKTKGGDVPLPSNCYGILAEQYEEDMRRGNGETWAVDFDEMSQYKPGRL